MELRKIIKFGRATYSITLPKPWIIKHDLKKGDVVRVEQSASGKLKVTPNKLEENIEVREIDINANGKTSEEILREVVAAYIKNYTIINIVGPIKGKLKNLRTKLQPLIGLEIMEVTPKKIVAKSFLDVTETKVEHTIKRIYYIIKSMSETFTHLVQGEGGAEEIDEMDNEINRNNFFTMKYLFKALEKPELASKMGMKNFEILFTWELVKQLEYTADKIKMMAEIIQNREVLIKKEHSEQFLSLYKEVEENFIFTMEEYFKGSKENTNKIFTKFEELDKKCNEFIMEFKHDWSPLLMDHLKDINMYTRNIAEIIVDFD